MPDQSLIIYGYHKEEAEQVANSFYRSGYEEGHILRAVDLDTNTLESPETWNRRTPEELKESLEKRGIIEDTTVILYGRFSFPDNNDPFPVAPNWLWMCQRQKRSLLLSRPSW